MKTLDKILEEFDNNLLQCEGCRTIRAFNFPFGGGYEGGDGFVDHYIDQEGCGIKGHDFLKIYYCPVCGKKLNSI